MARYLLKRSIQILVTLFVFLSLVFFIVNAQPGDVTNFYALNPDVPPETRQRLQELFGVNEPLWKQYLVHIKNTFTGNFGISFSYYPRSVADVIKERLPRTIVLFATATVVSFYLGFALGKIIAWRRGGWTEYTGTMLLTRNSMLETMREDFVMAARAKGLPERDVRDKHVA